MTETTRRGLIAAASTVALAGHPMTAAAQTAPAPTASRQAPGFYRFKVGEAEITVLHDGYVGRRAEGLVRNVPLPEVEAALRASFLNPDALENVYNITVVRTGTRTIMFDSGFADNGAPTTGQMAANMAAAGITPASIDTVITTHFHPDHINGVRLKAGALTYPNAQILVPAQEWGFWMDDGRATQAPEAQRGNFNLARRVFSPNAGDIKRFEWNTEVAPGITAIGTPGHTPGHTSFVLASGNSKILIQGDASGIPALFVRNPGWHSGFDMDPQMAEASRRKLYDMAVVERIPVIGYHFPFPAVGHLAKDGTGYRLELAHWRSVV